MKTIILLENSTILSLAESWGRTCTVMNDSPLSAAYWNLEEMSGEKLLDELPPLQVNPAQQCRNLN
jgi:hypothetical protein